MIHAGPRIIQMLFSTYPRVIHNFVDNRRTLWKAVLKGGSDISGDGVRSAHSACEMGSYPDVPEFSESEIV